MEYSSGDKVLWLARAARSSRRQVSIKKKFSWCRSSWIRSMSHGLTGRSFAIAASMLTAISPSGLLTEHGERRAEWRLAFFLRRSPRGHHVIFHEEDSFQVGFPHAGGMGTAISRVAFLAS